MGSKVVLFSGKQGSGKTTATKALEAWALSHGWVFWATKFAAPLYDMHDKVLGVLGAAGIQTPKKDGALLQVLGTEWGRKQYGEDIWARIVRGKVDREIKFFEEKNERVLIVIDDCRFPNELAAFPDAYRVRLSADRETRKLRAEGWRDNEMHESEVALDGLNDSNWDRVISTDPIGGENPEGIAQLIAADFLLK